MRRTPRRLRDEIEREREERDRLVVVEQPLGEAERAHDLAVLLLRRRLVERAAEHRHRDVARAALQRPLRRLPERLDDEGIAVRQRLLEVDGDLLGLGAGLGEDRRRAPVRGDALRGRHVVVHRRAHDRMRELERHLVVQEVGARERRRRVACELTLEAGERRRMRGAPRGRRAPRRRATSTVASDGRRDSRSETARATGSGPISVTRAAFSRDGSRPSRLIVSSSASTKSGLPPVAVQHAPTKSSCGSRPKSSRAMWPTESRPSAVGRTIAAAGSARISVTRASFVLCSGGRVATATSSGRPSSRRWRCASQRSDEPSAQWRSSIAIIAGRRSATFAASQ